MRPLTLGPGVMSGIDVVLLAIAEETREEVSAVVVALPANGAVEVVFETVELKVATR